jgi:Flp pilus assembly protein TadD
MRGLSAFLRSYSRDQYIAAALLILVLGVYAPVRHFGYVNYDDLAYVPGNLKVLSGLSAEGLLWAFTSTTDANWFPLTWISLMADCEIFGVAAGPQHWTNVMLHAASTLLLFALLKRMTGASGPSALVAFLFALHPLHVESVAWVAERKDVLSGLFWMLALWSYAGYAARPRASAYCMTLLYYCLGFLSKPMVVSLPLVLLLLDVWPLQRISLAAAEAGMRAPQALRLLREKLPFFLLALVMSVTTYAVQAHGGAVKTLGQFSVGARLGNAAISGAVYIGKTIWPTRLAVFYPFPTTQPPWQVLAAVLLLAGITILVLRLIGTRPYLAVGWFWYAITVLPVIGIVQVGNQARADRYTYLPGIGLFLMLAWSGADAWRRWPKARLPLAALCGAVCLASVALTARQVSYWQSGETLFQHSLEATGDNAFALLGVADAWGAAGLDDQAITEYRSVLAIAPHDPKALLDLGALLCKLGRFEEALPPLAELVRLKPGDAESHHNLGQVLAAQGRPDEALEQFEAAVRLKADYLDAQVSLGTVLVKLGRIDEAIAHFSEALRIDPDSGTAADNLRRAQAIRDRGGKQ